MFALIQTHISLSKPIKCKVLGRYGNENRLVVKITARNPFFKVGAIMHYSQERVFKRDRNSRPEKPLVMDWDAANLPVYEGKIS